MSANPRIDGRQLYGHHDDRSTMEPSSDDPRAWLGRRLEQRDVVAAAQVAAFAAVLDRDEPFPRPGDAAPPLFHWTLFPTAARQSELGADGHPRRGGFIPPVARPRRMWAGGRFRFHRP